MTRYLIDTNILVRMVSPHDPLNADDFRRYPGITAIDPHALTAPTSPESTTA